MQNRERRQIETREALGQFRDLEPCDLWEQRGEVVRVARRAQGADVNRFIQRLEGAERCNAFSKALRVLMSKLGVVCETHHS